MRRARASQGGGPTRIEDLIADRQRQLPEAHLSVRFGCFVVVVQSELGGELLEGEPIAQLGGAVLIGEQPGLPYAFSPWPVRVHRTGTAHRLVSPDG